jgi:hypothetical protein
LAERLVAAGISGASDGILTGLAAVGIDPRHFNLQGGIGSTMRIGLVAAVISPRTCKNHRYQVTGDGRFGGASTSHKSPVRKRRHGNHRRRVSRQRHHRPRAAQHHLTKIL